jgi:enoyl-CoA hydratase
MPFKNILYAKTGGVARITLNRPEVLNALSNALLDELVVALNQAEADDEVRVVVINGAGRAFCAGYDIEPGGPAVYGGESAIIKDWLWLQGNDKKIGTIWNLRKPVIAQVHGYCVAGGNDVAGQCDIVIAAEDALFMHPQGRRLGITWMHMTAYHAGLQWAKMLAFTGDPVTGKDAERIGLVAKAVPEDKLQDTVDALANRIALMPPDILYINKRAINGVAEGMGLRNALNAGCALDVISHQTQAVQDFGKAAAEKGLKQALADNEAPFKKAPRGF